MIPRKGAEVAEISEQSLIDVLEVRKALEELSVTLACERMVDKDFENLEQAAEKFKEALVRNDVMEIAEADVEFHDVINEASGNQKLIQLLSNFREQMYRFRIEYIKREDVRPSLIEEHQQIIKHLKERDCEGATTLIIEHINNQATSVKGQLKEQNNKR
jgi:DNA-binding GntR family transcriptional regulator